MPQTTLSQYEALLETLPIGIERIDTGGTILYSNPAHHKMAGYEPCELVGRKVFDLLAEPERAEELQQILEDLRRDQPEPEPWFALNRRKDGSTFEMRVDWQYERDEYGEVCGFVAAMTDITAQRRAERERDRIFEALAENRRHLASLMESAADFVLYRLAALPDNPYAGDVVFVSPSIREILGIANPRDFSSWFTNIVDEDRQRVLEANERSARTGEPFDELMRIHHPQKNELRWLRAISRPILDDAGRPTYFNGLILDVTSERRAEEEKRRFEARLLQSQKLESLGTMAGGVAHDFNNLLVGILGSSDLALESLPEESSARLLVENVVIAAQRAAELTNQLLAYSGKGLFSVEDADLNLLLEEMAAILKTAIAKTATLEVRLAEPLPTVRVDVSQIRQVIMNLITNASDALDGRPGTVTLATSAVEVSKAYLEERLPPVDLPPGRYARLDVTDTGKGMDAATLERIYDPFFTTKDKGHGLGLAAVRGILEAHGGAIHVQTAVGRGTTCSVLLPVIGAPLRRPVPAPAAAGREPARHRTILVVDDEELVRAVATTILERDGHTVLTAANGLDALEVFSQRADKIEVVLLDMNMPRMSGRETFERLRRLRSDLPVVFSTGFHQLDASDLLAPGKGIDFIQKPYRISELLEKIRGA